MKQMRIPARSASLHSRITQARSEARSVLSKFCVQKVIEEKLSTKNFNFSFDFDSGGGTVAKRSVLRLATLISADLKKHVPYISHAAQPFFRPEVNSDSVMYVLGDQKVSFETDRIAGGDRYEYITDRRLFSYVESLQRYCHKLTKRCFEKGIPLLLKVHVDSRQDQREDTYSVVTSKTDPSKVKVSFTLRVQIEVVIAVLSEVASRSVDRFTRLTENPRGIVHERFNGIARNGLWESPSYMDASAETIFTVIPEIRKCLRTLTRKVQYDPFAFIIGSE